MGLEETVVSSHHDSTSELMPALKPFSGYLPWLKSMTGLSDSSSRQYNSVVKQYLLALKNDMTPGKLIPYLKNHPRKTVKYAMIKYIKYQELDNLLPVIKEANIKFSDKRPKNIPTFEEFNIVIEALPREERAIAKYLLTTGSRCGEAMNVKLCDLMGYEVTIYGKGDKYRKVGLPKNIMDELFYYLTEIKGIASMDKIFYTESGASNETKVKMFWKILNRVAFRSIDKGIGSHDFRRYFATYLYLKTRDIKLVKDILGHASVDTTMIYVDYLDKGEGINKQRDISSELGDRLGKKD